MSLDERTTLTAGEQAAVQTILDRIATLSQFLKESTLPQEPSPEVLYEFLARMKQIQGNTDNGCSLVACLLAKQYLSRHLDMASFDVALKPQGAPGLDIDEQTAGGERVVGEIKTTVPYGTKDLGAAQKYSFDKDFEKLNAVQSAKKFFFVTDPRTFDLMRSRYARKIPGVSVVLLPGGQSFVA